MTSKELIFRAWNKIEKKWESLETSWSFDELTGEIIFFPEPVPEASEWLEIMQFTGVKDINDKRIFEGDIIQQFGYDPIERVPFKEYSVVVWDQDNCEYRLEEAEGFKIDPKPSDYGVVVGSFSAGIECEVIGNVFQNPELII